MNPFQNMEKCLRKQITMHQRLLELATQKMQILIEGDIQELRAKMSAETDLMKQIKQLEVERMFILRETRNNTDKEWTLSKFIESLSDVQEIMTLQKLGGDLLDHIQKVKEQNHLNQQLIKQSLDYVTFTMDLLTQPADDDLNYAAKSRHAKKPNHLFFDRKA